MLQTIWWGHTNDSYILRGVGSNNEHEVSLKIRNWISSFNPLNTNFFATMMWQNLPFFYNYIDDGIHMDSVLFLLPPSMNTF
jgi:hypothetical protein